MNFIRAINIILALSVDTLYINIMRKMRVVRACASHFQFCTHVYKKILSIFEQKLGLDLFKSIELMTLTLNYHF